MSENSQDIEWWIYDMDHNDYFLSFNKNTIQKIKDWEVSESVIFYTSQNHSLQDIEEYMRKKLILWLLSDEDRKNKMSNAVVNKDWKNVFINISKDLLDTLLAFKSNYICHAYEYRYNTHWDKMQFYVDDNYQKTCLNDDINFYSQLFDQKFPQDK